MPEISYKEVETYLQSLLDKKGKGAFAPVCLIFGEEFLCKTVFDKLLNAMIPAGKRELNYELCDDAQVSVFDLVEKLSTYAITPGLKVVAVKDTRIFNSRTDAVKLFAKAREAYHAQEMEKAARAFVSYAGLLNLTWEELQGDNRKRLLKAEDANGAEDGWTESLTAYCLEKEIAIPSAGDSAEVLQKAVEKGFPKGNHLILTCDSADRRRSLFKVLKDQGLMVDCTVPAGERKADKTAQESVLRENLQALLRKHQKTLDPEAYRRLIAMTGFDLRTFSQNIEKLVAFAGERQRITVEDVASVAQRTRRDPIFELTNALAERNLENALFFLSSLLADNFHPLQLLAALVNQVRKLLLAKDFTESERGRVWQDAISYGQFTKSVMPALQAADEALMAQLGEWHHALAEAGEKAPKGARKKKTAKAATDLVVAKNPRSPYPVYQLLLRAANFSAAELERAVELLHAADLQLKTSAQNPRLVLETVLLQICGAPASPPRPKGRPATGA